MKKNFAPIDPDVKVPAAIRAAAARSEALHKEVYETDEKPENDNAPKQDGKPEEQQQEPKPEQQEEQKEEQRQEKPKQEEPKREEPKSDEQEDWRHKYNSLKGRFDRNEELIRGQNQRIAQLEQLLASHKAAAPQQQEQPNTELRFKPISDEDREAYGEDFIDMVQRAAATQFLPQIEALQKQVRELGGHVQSTVQQAKLNTRQSMYDYLDREQANWRQLNKDDRFIAWANLPDPFSGDIRINLMRDAFEKGDAPRVLRFFKGFLADEAATEPADNRKPEMPAQGKVPLETFAAPGRAKAPAATTPPGQKETITRAQIAAFYKDVAAGKYRGNEAEKERLENEIFKADAEGRVI